MIESSLYSALSDNAALAALVGTRISPALSVQAGTLPCVTFHQVTGNYNYTQDGVDTNVEDWWQFNAWGRSYEAMRAVCVAIIDTLHAGTSPISFHAFVDQRQDLYEDDTRIHHGLIVARIWWKAAPSNLLFDDATGNFDDMSGNFDTPAEA